MKKKDSFIVNINYRLNQTRHSFRLCRVDRRNKLRGEMSFSRAGVSKFEFGQIEERVELTGG